MGCPPLRATPLHLVAEHLVEGVGQQFLVSLLCLFWHGTPVAELGTGDQGLVFSAAPHLRRASISWVGAVKEGSPRLSVLLSSRYLGPWGELYFSSLVLGRGSPVFLAVPVWNGVSTSWAGRGREGGREALGLGSYHRLTVLMNYYRFSWVNVSSFSVMFLGSFPEFWMVAFLIIFTSCAGEQICTASCSFCHPEVELCDV